MCEGLGSKMAGSSQDVSGNKAGYATLQNIVSARGLHALPAVSLVAIPALCLWTTPNILTQASFVDPYIYTGYIYNSASLVSRFGTTYYALRVAAIAPQQLAHWLLGPEAGYAVMRYLLLLAGCASIFAIVKRFFGVGAALYSAALLAFAPWYLRSLTWEYVDGFASTYLLIGFAFILAPRRPTNLGYLCAGAFFALAANSNLYAIAIAAAFVPALAYLRFNDARARLSDHAAATVAGFLLTYALLAAVVHHTFPTLGLFFEAFTLHVARELLSGGSQRWFQELKPYIAAGHYFVLVPFIIFLAGSIYTAAIWTDAAAAQSRKAVAAFTGSLGIVIALYLINHYAFHSPRITRFYYFSYASIPSYLALSAMIGAAAQRLPPKLSAMALSCAATLSLLIWLLNGAASLYAYFSYLLFAVTTALFLLGAATARRWPIVALSSACIFGAALPGFFYHSGSPYRELQSRTQAVDERDVYSGTLHLIKVVERSAPPSAGPIAFWYDATLPAHSWLSSVQSAYLFWSSKLPSPAPAVDEKNQAVLREKKILVLLGLGEAEIADYEKALAAANVGFAVRRSGEYRGARLHYRYAILGLFPNP